MGLFEKAVPKKCEIWKSCQRITKQALNTLNSQGKIIIKYSRKRSGNQHKENKDGIFIDTRLSIFILQLWDQS